MATALMFILAPTIVGYFAKEQRVFDLGVAIMRIYVFAMLISSAGSLISSSYWFSGDTKPPMAINLLVMWGFQIPMVFILVYWLKLTTLLIWYIGILAAIINLLLIWLIFRTERWKRVKV